MAENYVVPVVGGDVKGVVKEGVVSFKGIPFAAPPIGERRWRPPQPVIPWKGVKVADQYGFDCMQDPFPGDAAPLGGPISEDCLYLNIWQPAVHRDKPLPVMVWIHGGGYVNGGSSPAVYSGEHFAESGIVFVSFNYRLGRFGFYAHPALTEEGKDHLLGNYAFMDQIAALEWVQKNIGKFGGDPHNVTIFGESAGGGSVNTLMTANPRFVSGLFHKAIAQSGGGRTRGWWATRLRNDPNHPAKQGPTGEEMGVAFAKSKGIITGGAEALKALRALPAEEIVNGMNMAKAQRDTFPGPMIDGLLVQDTIEGAYRKGNFQRVPYMAGANSHEWVFMVEFRPEPARALAQDFLEKTGVSETKAFTLFGTSEYKDPLALLGGLVQGDMMFLEPARYVASALERQGNPSWLYRFDYVAESLRGKVLGAMHATEIPFVFKTLDSRYETLTENDWRMAEKMHQRWVAFAKGESPSEDKNWKQFSISQQRLFLFSNNHSEFVVDPAKQRLDLVEMYSTQSK